jgi:hypothetical protein
MKFMAKGATNNRRPLAVGFGGKKEPEGIYQAGTAKYPVSRLSFF